MPSFPHRNPEGKTMTTHAAWIARTFGRRDFAPLTTADLEVLSAILETRHVEAGQRILSPGQPADAAYIVESGEVELFVRRGGRRVLIGIQRAGGVFGDVPLLCGMPFPFSAVARDESTLLRLERGALLQLLSRHPAIALRWLSSVVRRLELANRRILELAVGDLRARALALFADELVGGAGVVRLTQAEIAALLGATRQSVNRVLGRLTDEGLIRQEYGEIRILDPERVLELSGGAAAARAMC
jgi:CRP-like cAMP-binding protein